MTDAQSVAPTVATIREHLPPQQKTPPVVLISLDELWARPAAEQLIAGVLPSKGLVVLFGEPKSGKSFIALDMAVSIAAEQSWQGHATKTGAVVYVVAEGADEFGKRTRGMHQALDDAGGQRLRQNLWVVGKAVHLLRDGSASLREGIEAKGVRPVLIVIDTLARTFPPGDENSAKDMNAYVAACDELREYFACAVLLVHHSAKGKLDLRGSSALRGAADTVIAVETKDGLITLTCQAQKDDAPFEPIRLSLQVVDVANDGGPYSRTCRVVLERQAHVEVIVDADVVAAPAKAPKVRQRVFEVLSQGGVDLSAADVQKRTGASLSSVYEALGKLVDDQLVERDLESGRYRLRLPEAAS